MQAGIRGRQARQQGRSRAAAAPVDEFSEFGGPEQDRAATRVQAGIRGRQARRQHGAMRGGHAAGGEVGEEGDEAGLYDVEEPDLEAEAAAAEESFEADEENVGGDDPGPFGSTGGAAW